MAGRPPPTSLSTAGLAFFSSLCLSTFGLGTWQTSRYVEKTATVDVRRDETAAAPRDDLERDARCSPGEIGAGAAGKEEEGGESRGFGRWSVRGRYRHGDEVLVGPRGPPPGAVSATGPNSGRSAGGMSSSPQGYFVITPLDRENGMGTVLIDRGWVPRQYVQQKAPWYRPDGVVGLVGVPAKTETPRFLSPPHDPKHPRQLLWFDRRAIERVTRTAGSAPLLLKETTPSPSPSDDDRDDAAGPRFPVTPSVETVGEFKVPPSTHAGYAVTWFGLSGAGIFMTRKLVLRGRG